MLLVSSPSTMGLDAWRLYETIWLTRRPVDARRFTESG
jgi:hypothetical protein